MAVRHTNHKWLYGQQLIRRLSSVWKAQCRVAHSLCSVCMCGRLSMAAISTHTTIEYVCMRLSSIVHYCLYYEYVHRTSNYLFCCGCHPSALQVSPVPNLVYPFCWPLSLSHSLWLLLHSDFSIQKTYSAKKVKVSEHSDCPNNKQ